jgi:hypothetical protein
MSDVIVRVVYFSLHPSASYWCCCWTITEANGILTLTSLHYLFVYLFIHTFIHFKYFLWFFYGKNMDLVQIPYHITYCHVQAISMKWLLKQDRKCMRSVSVEMCSLLSRYGAPDTFLVLSMKAIVHMCSNSCRSSCKVVIKWLDLNENWMHSCS